jgi:hypothetical protein
MRTRHLLLTPVATAALLLGVASQALAAGDGPGGWVDVDDEGSEVDVGATDGDSTSGGRTGGSSSGCTWELLTEGDVDGIWQQVDDDRVTDPRSYDWYWVTCPDETGGEYTDLVPVPVSDPVPVDPTVLRDEAVETLVLPTPTIGTSPSGDQVVHVETWLWVDGAIWQPQRQSASAGAVTATVTATPRQVTWDLGNGDSVTCNGPGTAYDTSIPAEEQTTDCSYTYTSTSAGQPGDAYEVTATIEWSVEWTVSGAAGGGALPALFTAAPTSVRVAELQALNQ